MVQKIPTREELIAAGVTLENIADNTRDASILASSWDVYANDRAAIGEERLKYHMAHIRPASILVTPIGQLYDEGVWWRLQDCLYHTAKAGYSVSLQELSAAAVYSSEAIFLMRWQASMFARDGGLEWLFMIDTDVWLEKDTILRLIAHDRPVVFPFLDDMEKRLPRIIAPLSGPDLVEPGHGLVPVRWAAMSCMLFNPRIFNVLDSNAWRGDDNQFAQTLNHIGHRIYVDTDTVVKTTRGPTRHYSKEYDEYWADHEKMWDRLRNEERDRRPPPNFNPLKDEGFVDQHGVYLGMSNKVARGNSNGPKRRGSELWIPS